MIHKGGEKRKASSQAATGESCLPTDTNHTSAFSRPETSRKRISCMTAQTMVRQLVSVRACVNLIRPLANIAKEAFNRIGAANVAMHDRRKRIKGQKMFARVHAGCGSLQDSVSGIWRRFAARL